MRLSAGNVVNAAAAAVLAMLICAAVVVADVLGFVGLLILGAITWLVCVRAELDEGMPTWSTEAFRARMEGPASPEQRAALSHERRTVISPLRYYRWFGIVLSLAGSAGLIWQLVFGGG